MKKYIIGLSVLFLPLTHGGSVFAQGNLIVGQGADPFLMRDRISSKKSEALTNMLSALEHNEDRAIALEAKERQRLMDEEEIKMLRAYTQAQEAKADYIKSLEASELDKIIPQPLPEKYFLDQSSKSRSGYEGSALDKSYNDYNRMMSKITPAHEKKARRESDLKKFGARSGPERLGEMWSNLCSKSQKENPINIWNRDTLVLIEDYHKVFGKGSVGQYLATVGQGGHVIGASVTSLLTPFFAIIMPSLGQRSSGEFRTAGEGKGVLVHIGELFESKIMQDWSGQLTLGAKYLDKSLIGNSKKTNEHNSEKMRLLGNLYLRTAGMTPVYNEP